MRVNILHKTIKILSSSGRVGWNFVEDLRFDSMDGVLHEIKWAMNFPKKPHKFDWLQIIQITKFMFLIALIKNEIDQKCIFKVLPL